MEHTQGRMQPVRFGGGRFQWYLVVKSHCGFSTVRGIWYASQPCCDKTMEGKTALYRECCFPNCTKFWWKKLLSYGLGGAMAQCPPWIRRTQNHVTTTDAYSKRIQAQPTYRMQNHRQTCSVQVSVEIGEVGEVACRNSFHCKNLKCRSLRVFGRKTNKSSRVAAWAAP